MQAFSGAGQMHWCSSRQNCLEESLDQACNEVQGYLIGRPEPIVSYFGLVGRKAPSASSLALAS